MILDDESLDNWSNSVYIMLETLINNKIPFYVLIESDDSNFTPELPEFLQANKSTLFHIAGDVLGDIDISFDGIDIKLFLDSPEGGSTSHVYHVGDRCKINAIIQDFDGKPGEPMYIIPRIVKESIESIEMIDYEAHSMNHFLKNPANDKFFKK